MSKLYSYIIAIFILSSCTNTDPLTVDDLFFLLGSGEATSSFDEGNMHIYSNHIDRVRKLEKIGLITVKIGSLDIDNKIVLYTNQHTTDLGKAIIDKINNKTIASTTIPINLLKQIDDMEATLSKSYKLNLRQFIFLTKRSSGDISAPGNEIFTIKKDDIELVKTLSIKGFMKYSIIDDTFNGKPAKSFRWRATHKGIEFKVKYLNSHDKSFKPTPKNGAV